jgi:hypothetical protein
MNSLSDERIARVLLVGFTIHPRRLHPSNLRKQITAYLVEDPSVHGFYGSGVITAKQIMPLLRGIVEEKIYVPLVRGQLRAVEPEQICGYEVRTKICVLATVQRCGWWRSSSFYASNGCVADRAIHRKTNLFVGFVPMSWETLTLEVPPTVASDQLALVGNDFYQRQLYG